MVSKRTILAAISAVLIVWLVLSLLFPYLFLPPIPRQEPYDVVPEWGTGVTIGSDEDTFLDNITLDNVDLNFTWDFNPSLTIGIVSPAEPPRYWRNIVYDTYTGSNWGKSNSTTQNLSPVNPGSEIVYTIQQNITHGLTGSFPLLHLWPDPMIIVNSIQCPTLPDPSSFDLTTDEYGTAILAGRFNQSGNTTLQYRVTFNPLNWTTIRPQAQSASLTPSALLTQYQQQGLTQLSGPTRTDIQMRLASILAGVPDNAFEEAFAILDYFKATFTFDPLAPRPSSNDESVEFFLNQGAGVGLDFSTAYTMFLRENGIAARPVFGAVLGENRGTRRVLHLMHAHFWVEVYVPINQTHGHWLQFDPTPLPSYITDGSPPPSPSTQKRAPPVGSMDQDPYVISTYYELTIVVPTPIVDRFVSFQIRATLLKDGNPEPGETLWFYDDTEAWLLGSNDTSVTGEASITYSYDNTAIVGFHLLRVTFHARSEYSGIALHGTANLTFSATPLEINRTRMIQFTGVLRDDVNGRGLSYNETAFTEVRILLNLAQVTGALTYANGQYSVLYPIPSSQDPLGLTAADATFSVPSIIDPTSSTTEWLNITATSQLSVQAIPNAIRVNGNVTLSGQLRYENGTGIAGQSIELFWDSSPIGPTTTDSSGNYQLNYTPTVLGQVTINAQFLSGNNIFGSSAVTTARVHDEGTIVVFVDDDDGDDLTQRGAMVNFSGWVENQTGIRQPFVEVLIYLNSTNVVNTTTLADGSFSLSHQLSLSRNIGLYEVTGNVESAGPLVVISTIDYLTINSTTQIDHLQFNMSRVLIGETITLSGQIIDDQRIGLANRDISFRIWYLSTSIPVGSTTSRSDGTFSHTLTIPSGIPATVSNALFEATYGGSQYYGSSSNASTLDIFVTATLTLDVSPGPYSWNASIPVNGTLIDNFGRPLPDRLIQLYVDGVSLYSAASNSQGAITFLLRFTPTQNSTYRIQLQHQTVVSFNSLERIIIVEALQPMQPLPFPIELVVAVIVIVIVVVVAIIVYRWWRRRPRRSSTPSIDASAMLTTLRQLLSDQKYRESIIYAFRMFETIVQAKLGLFRDPSITLREFGNLAVAHGQLNSRNMEVFIRGVEEARFSDHSISYNFALSTLSAFAKIYNSLTGGNLRFVTQEQQQPEQKSE